MERSPVIWKVRNILVIKQIKTDLYRRRLLQVIKALTALMGRLSPNVSWKIGPERGLKSVSFNSYLPVNFNIKYFAPFHKGCS